MTRFNKLCVPHDIVDFLGIFCHNSHRGKDRVFLLTEPGVRYTGVHRLEFSASWPYISVCTVPENVSLSVNSGLVWEPRPGAGLFVR